MTHEIHEKSAQGSAAHAGRWRILGLLGVAQLMLILDVTVVAIALPRIEIDLGLSRAVVTWTVSAYTLTFGGLLLLGGRMADLAGARRVVLAGLLVFSAASLVTGLAGSPGMLLGGRIAQGVGAALLSPAALSLVVTLFDGDERNKALGVWSALGGGGAALGVLLGGLLTAGPGWPWVFYINVPIGLIIAAAIARMVPHQRAPAPRARLDVLGALLVTASSGVVIYALINAGDNGWLTAATGWLLLLAAAGYLAFVMRQKTAGTPLLDVRLLARRPVAAGTFLILMATALMIAVFFLGTFYFQHARGYGPLQTGLLFLPVALATMLGANLTGRAIARLGARRLAVAGVLAAAIGMTVPALSMHPATVVTGVTIAAAGTGAMFVVASATALGQVARTKAVSPPASSARFTSSAPPSAPPSSPAPRRPASPEIPSPDSPADSPWPRPPRAPRPSWRPSWHPAAQSPPRLWIPGRSNQPDATCTSPPAQRGKDHSTGRTRPSCAATPSTSSPGSSRNPRCRCARTAACR